MRRRGRGCGGVGGKSSGGEEVDSVAEVWSGLDGDEGGKDCSVDGARLSSAGVKPGLTLLMATLTILLPFKTVKTFSFLDTTR